MGWQQMIIVGNVGQDPKFEYTQQGVARCNFTVAVSRVSGKGEDRKEETQWFNVTIWRQLAETANQYVKKGRQIMIVGELKTRIYTDRNGQPAVALDLTAREMQLLGNRAEGGDAPEVVRGKGASSAASDSDDPGDLPF